VLAAVTPRIDWPPIGPELVLVGTGIIVLLAGVFLRRRATDALLVISLAGVIGAAAVSVTLWHWHGSLTVLNGMVATDRFSVVTRLTILGVTALGLLFGHHYFDRIGETRNEFYALVLFCASGMTLFASGSDLIAIFLGLEILSLSLYVLTGFSPRLGATEASMKYFLLGSFSSAFFLFGVAMAYGATGGTNLGDIAGGLSGTTGNQALAVTALALLAIGFSFKVALVPFHMWTPDVYQGAPTAVTAFMSAGTKVAAFAALIRVFFTAFQPLTWDWTPVVWVLAAVTVVVGSVLAISQTDIKRMLAYSSIAHAGFILMALSAADQNPQAGIRAALFYLVAYAAMIAGAFGVVMLVSGHGEERTALAAYRGLYRRSPVLTGLLTVFLLSMAGIPPAAGFIAKVGVFSAAIAAGHWELALIGVVASVVAAFFYIRVLVLMYMYEPEGDVPTDPAPVPVFAVALAAAVTLVLGVLPGIVLGLLDTAAVLRW
jgi:NADH-quinone oxidoreductase subunit N